MLFSKKTWFPLEILGLIEELRRVKAELLRVTEERDILKKAAAYFAKESG